MADGYGLVQIRSGNTLYDFGTITGITDTLNKAISAFPIPTLPTDSTFALESNTSNRFHITFARKNPVKVLEDGSVSTYEGDEDYWTTSWKWTNALWVEAVLSLNNRSQYRTDGYKAFINVKDVERTLEISGDTYSALSELFPSYQGVNVYSASIETELVMGNAEVVTGSITLVIGGKLTDKYSVDRSSDQVLFDHNLWEATPSTYIPKRGSSYYLTSYVPLFNTSESGNGVDYNRRNEYTDRIMATNARIYITAHEFKSGELVNSLTLPLTIGKPYQSSQASYDWQFDYASALDMVNSYTLQGGVENPFEKLVLKMSKRAFVRTYPEVGVTTSDKLTTTGDINAKIIPGVSKITLMAVGGGTFTVTECSLSNNIYTITAYCEADKLRSLSIPPGGYQWVSPLAAILDILGTTNWGLSTPFDSKNIITNVNDLFYGDLSEDQKLGLDSMSKHSKNTAIFAKGGANTWVFLQACAYILNAKIFFANNKAYIIDYTKLWGDYRDSDVDDTAPIPDTSAVYQKGNRLILRAGMDRGQHPSDNWGISAISGMKTPTEITAQSRKDGVDYSGTLNELDSMELHTENSLDRLAGRVYGTVSQDPQGTTTIFNTVHVRFNAYVLEKNKTYVKDLWFGQKQENTALGLEKYYGEWITSESYLANPTGDASEYVSTEYKGDEYAQIQAIAKQSIERNGVSEYVLDLTPYFTVLPEEYARRALYTVLYYRAEAQETVKFTLNERCSGDPSDKATGYGESYWSALFPLVSAARQFTDIEQELKVSAISDYSQEFLPQKLALSKYSRDYPSGRSTYTFGVTNSVDLASSTSQILTRMN